MQTRTLGRTGRTVSVIGLGTWQLGVAFFDTADVYGDGRSETLIGRFDKLSDRCAASTFRIAEAFGLG